MASYSDKDSFKGKMISQKTAKVIYKASDHYEIPAGTRFKLKGETPGETNVERFRIYTCSYRLSSVVTDVAATEV